ncbi:DUF6710 family protein, partial [Escherichia coli]
EWVHVQLHQQKGMISLSPPTICNSAVYDMRYLLDIVSTDGYYWYMSGKICERVSDYRTAAFFEIGRLLTL